MHEEQMAERADYAAGRDAEKRAGIQIVLIAAGLAVVVIAVAVALFP